MDRPFVDGERRLLDRFAHARVGVDGARNVFGRSAELHRQDCLGQEVACQGT